MNNNRSGFLVKLLLHTITILGKTTKDIVDRNQWLSVGLKTTSGCSGINKRLPKFQNVECESHLVYIFDQVVTAKKITRSFFKVAQWLLLSQRTRQNIWGCQSHKWVSSWSSPHLLVHSHTYLITTTPYTGLSSFSIAFWLLGKQLFDEK